MASWRLAVAADGVAWAPSLGEWEIDAALRGSPSGGPVDGVSAPAAAVRYLGEEDLVTGIRIRTAPR
jgi:hypothetical protein